MGKRVTRYQWFWLVGWLLLGASYSPAPVMAAEERNASIDLAAVTKAHQAFLLDASGPNGRAPQGQEDAAIVAQRRKLRAIQQRLAREASRLSETERRALREQVEREITALQELLAQEMNAAFLRQRWASADNVALHIRGRVEEFGKERALSLILDRTDHKVLYRDPTRMEATQTDTVDPALAVDVTRAFIEWLREKDRDLAPPAGPLTSGF